MNGDYPLSPTPKGQDVFTKFPKAYKDWPVTDGVGGIEYFDMYSPLFSQLYSQVWWSGLSPTPFPKDVIERYAGRGMLIAGFEMDQVRRPKGCECPEGGACNDAKPECATTDMPVPLTCAYNHHFESSIRGAKARHQSPHPAPRVYMKRRRRCLPPYLPSPLPYIARCVAWLLTPPVSPCHRLASRR